MLLAGVDVNSGEVSSLINEVVDLLMRVLLGIPLCVLERP